MRVLVFLLSLALSFPAVAQDKPPAKKDAKKSAAKKKSEPKPVSQDWGRFNSSASKSLDAKKDAKKDAAKKK